MINKKIFILIGWLIATMFLCRLFSYFYISDMGKISNTGYPLGCDFFSFWRASYIYIHNNIADVWNAKVLHHVQDMILNKQTGYNIKTIGFFDFSYPPVFMLYIFWLAFFPYGISFFIWIVFTLLLVYLSTKYWINKTNAQKHKILILLSNPFVLFNMFAGQNGNITMALWGWGARNLEEKPMCGLALGLLSFKPQLGLVILPVLIFGRYWKALFWAIVGGGVPVIITLLLWGLTPWISFFHHLNEVKNQLLTHDFHFEDMASVYSSFRLMNFSYQTAMIFQIIFSVISLFVISYFSYKRLNGEKIGLLMICLTPFVSPYYYDYDMAILTIPLLYLIRNKNILETRRVFLLILTYFSILIIRDIQKNTHIPFAILINILMLYMVCKDIGILNFNFKKNKILS